MRIIPLGLTSYLRASLDQGKVDPEAGSRTQATDHGNAAPLLLDNAVNHGKSQANPKG